MARRRMVDPDIWEDEKINSLDFAGRLFFIGLITQANDYGKLRGNEKLLKARIFPYDDKIDIKKYLQQLSKLGIILIYQINDETFIKIKNWGRHQTLTYKGKDTFPEPTLNQPLTNPEPTLNQPLRAKELKELKELNTLSGKNKKPDIEAPILYLNERAGRNFDPKNKANRDLIEARYKEGRTLEQFKKVIDKKVADWSSDENMMKYLRPETLFTRKHFESYLNEPKSMKEMEKEIGI